MTDRLNSKDKIVGVKQVQKALDLSQVEAVYVANDADEKIVSDIIKQCEEEQVQIIYVDNMKKLGVACGIDINAATAALLK